MGRLSLLAIPGVSLSMLVVLVAGVAYGVRAGAATGFVSRLASDLIISGLNPVFIPMAVVDTIIGALAGLVGRGLNLGQRGPAPPWFTRSVLLGLAIVFTVGWSILADTTTWAFYRFLLPDVPDAASDALWGTFVLAGILFNVPATFVNAALFPAAIPPVLNALRSAALLPEPAPKTLDPPGPVPLNN